MPRKKGSTDKKPRKKAEKPAQPVEIAKPDVKAVLVELSPDKYFILCNGSTIKDYKELASILETIGDDIFYYHVTEERNDFANWINDVFEEHELAEAMRNSKSRHEMMAIIYKHLFHKLERLYA